MKNRDGIQFILVCVIGIVLIGVLIPLADIYNLKIDIDYGSKKTYESEIDNGIFIKTNNIVLDNFNDNITISEAGEYNVKGTFNFSILVNANDKVILNLNGVDINSKITSAIANRGTNELVINLVDESVNNLKDDGYSVYDGCIYSRGKLTIGGNGILNIVGNQENGEGISTTDADIIINGGNINIVAKDDGINVGGGDGILEINGGNIKIGVSGDGIDSNGKFIMNDGVLNILSGTKGKTTGIDTDNGIEINGGNIVAFGSSDYQIPLDSSTQKFIGFYVKDSIKEDSKILLVNDEGLEFELNASQEFKTLIYSNPNIEEGIYYLYIDDVQTEFSFNVY